MSSGYRAYPLAREIDGAVRLGGGGWFHLFKPESSYHQSQIRTFLYMIAAVRVGSFVFYQWWQCIEELWHAKFAMRELKHFCDAFLLVTVLLNKMIPRVRGTSPDFEDKRQPV